jgi:hypothetical protein
VLWGLEGAALDRWGCTPSGPRRTPQWPALSLLAGHIQGCGHNYEDGGTDYLWNRAGWAYGWRR